MSIKNIIKTITTTKIPQRKCIGCKEMKDKKDLIRIVRDKQQNFSIDLTGKLPGRGAYICKSSLCLKQAQKSKGFQRSFKAPAPKNLYEELEVECE